MGVAATFASLFAACGQSTRSDADRETAGSAGDSGSAGTGTGGSAGDGTGGSSGTPVLPRAECDARFAALDDSCTTDDECAVAVRYFCWYAGGSDRTSPALGIRADELDTFGELAEACGMPDDSSDCPIGEGTGGRAPASPEETTNSNAPHSAITVACKAGHCSSFWTLCGPTCGNGERDSCRVEQTERGPLFVPVPEDPTSFEVFTEACDGTDFGRDSCSARGLATGELSCDPDECVVDASDCKPCFELDDGLLDCSFEHSDIQPQVVALAATDDYVAAVWGSDALHFALYSDDLAAPLAEDSILLEGVNFGSEPLSMAAVPEGWLAVLTEPVAKRTHLYLWDATGAFVGERAVFDSWGSAFLVSRTSGAPLLLTRASAYPASTWAVSALSADFTEVAETVELGTFDPGGAQTTPSAAFVGDHLLVAAVADNETHVLNVDTERFELIGDRVLHLADYAYGNYYLASNGTDAVLFAELLAVEDARLWVRLDATGAPTSPVVDLNADRTLEVFGRPTIIADAAYLPVRRAVDTFDILGIDTANRPFGEKSVAREGGSPYGYVAVVAQGNELVVGAPWSNGILLARVAP